MILQPYNLIDPIITSSKDLMKQLEFVKESVDFQGEANNNLIRSKWWLIGLAFLIVTFISLIVRFIYFDSHSVEIIKDASVDTSVKQYIPFLLGSHYVTKALLMSVLIYIMGWFLKNYKSERHNYVINKHKAMSLTVAISILKGDDYDNTSRGHVFIDAMRIVFAHQSSGFSTEDVTSPNIVNTLLSKDV